MEMISKAIVDGVLQAKLEEMTQPPSTKPTPYADFGQAEVVRDGRNRHQRRADAARARKAAKVKA